MYRVVIADDEVLIRMYIREILENNGYEVEEKQKTVWMRSQCADRKSRILLLWTLICR